MRRNCNGLFTHGWLSNVKLIFLLILLSQPVTTESLKTISFSFSLYKPHAVPYDLPPQRAR